jgi:uncharacterized protein (TIGR02246 family)
MTISSPTHADPTWMERFNAGDIEGLLDLYEPDALFVPEPGAKPLSGPDAVRDFAANFPLKDPKVDLRTRVIYERDEDALLYSDWTMTGTGPDGPTQMEGQATVLLRKQSDGRWLLAFDDPFTQR